jgi:hypothetical protein
VKVAGITTGNSKQRTDPLRLRLLTTGANVRDYLANRTRRKQEHETVDSRGGDTA